MIPITLFYLVNSMLMIMLVKATMWNGEFQAQIFHLLEQTENTKPVQNCERLDAFVIKINEPNFLLAISMRVRKMANCIEESEHWKHFVFSAFIHSATWNSNRKRQFENLIRVTLKTSTVESMPKLIYWIYSIV